MLENTSVPLLLLQKNKPAFHPSAMETQSHGIKEHPLGTTGDPEGLSKTHDAVSSRVQGHRAGEWWELAWDIQGGCSERLL